MKRFRIALLFVLVALVPTAWAASITPTPPPTDRYTLTVVHHGDLVSEVDLLVPAGETAPFSVVRKQSYIQAACTITESDKQALNANDNRDQTFCGLPAKDAVVTDKGSKTILVPGEITSGLTGSLVTDQATGLTHVRVNYSSLDQLITFSKDDLSIQLPQTTTQAIDGYLSLKAGESATLHSGGARDWMVTVTRH